MNENIPTGKGESAMNIEISIREISGKQTPAVTSLQVAEAFGKQHGHVLRDIRETIDKCSESFTRSNFGLSEYTDSTGRKLPMYLLSKDGLMLVTMGYTSPEAMTVKENYISKFNQMEEQLKLDLPTFQNPALAARAWAEEYERRQIAEEQRDYYKRTKAEIGSRREATAMATASAAVRQVEALKEELGNAKNWKMVKGIDWLKDEFYTKKSNCYSEIGKRLKKLSDEMGYDVKKAPSPEYHNGINVYHIKVIEAFKREIQRDPSMLKSYRRK